jgi:hypothetical protein
MPVSSGFSKILIISDIHYASAAEKARGTKAEPTPPLARFLDRFFRHYIWQRDVFAHNHWLDAFIAAPDEPDWVVAVGDYSVAGYEGISDDACLASARECLEKLRSRFGNRFLPILGDHELGKTSLFGTRGGLRLASWRRAEEVLPLAAYWTRDLGAYRLMGIASSLVALPTFEPDALAVEIPEWRRLRAAHMESIRQGFASLAPGQKIILFCHDPTALPFLWRESVIQSRLNQVEQTIIGHLHTNLVLWQSRILAGMPRIRCLGGQVCRLTSVLKEAKYWKPFKVRLCPALSGIELWRQSGFYELRLDQNGKQPPHFVWRKLKQC